jgi:hypothetical protein
VSWQAARKCIAQSRTCRSGSPLDAQCAEESWRLAADAPCYLIVDTDVVLQQADFLEHASVQDVIVLSTVFQQVHRRNTGVFLRLKQMLAAAGKRFFYFSNEHCKARTPNLFWPSVVVMKALQGMRNWQL